MPKEITLHVLSEAILMHGGLMLALKRQSGVSLRPNYWDLPGGTVEQDEDIAEALRREVHEETGIGLLSELVPVHVATFHSKGGYRLAAVYATETPSAEVRISAEHTEYKWVSPEEALLLDYGEGGAFIVDAIKNFLRTRRKAIAP